MRQTVVATSLDDSVMAEWKTDLADDADADDLANQYEVLVLHGISIPAGWERQLREAHRTVHLRGIDPLRKVG